MTAAYESDRFTTSAGDLEITFLGHGSLYFTFSKKIFHIDPYSKVADYSSLPKADVVLLTHHHQDHLDPAALEQITTEQTRFILTEKCAEKISGGAVLHTGEELVVHDVHVRAVPAYNIEHKRPTGEPFHPKGEGLGYLLTFADLKVYVAGDTENTPEMKALRGIDVAFLPVNLPYTMTPAMAADAARFIRPRVLYPYHFGSTDLQQLVDLLKDEPDIEIRLRRLA
jgi:L-ascorbate metabolism protein UlaG (beta-lactamase superfamily)